MAKYLRRITRVSAWKKESIPLSEKDEDSLILSQIPADVFSICLCTDENKLSIWKAEGENWEQFHDVIATMVSVLDGPCKTDIVILDTDEIDMALENCPGETPAEDSMNALHYDIVNLNYKTVGNVACHIAKIMAKDIEFDENIKKIPTNKPSKPDNWPIIRFNEKKVIDIMKNAIANGVIDSNKLKERWRNKLI